MGSIQADRRLLWLGQFAIEQHAQVPNITGILWSELHRVTEGNFGVPGAASQTRQEGPHVTPRQCVFRTELDRPTAARLRFRSSVGCLFEKIAKAVQEPGTLGVKFHC